MNIYKKFALYIYKNLKKQKEMQIQETDLIYLLDEVNPLQLKIKKSQNPGWFDVSLVD